MFAGGGLCDVGLKAAGFTVVGAVEFSPEIAEWYVHNHGDHCHVADVADVDYRPYAGTDLLWASPCCTNASQANVNAGEEDTDHRSADAVCRAIREILPRWFTLENVSGYVHFASFQRILNTLRELGYQTHHQTYNTADYAVPQTRKRLILRASRVGRVPHLPPTHTEGGAGGGLFDEYALLPWVGWYAAIEDLLPALPESKFADWQMKRMPAWLDTCLVESKNANQQYGDGRRQVHEPATTVITDHKPSHLPKAFLCQKQAGARGDWRRDDEPSKTIAATDGAAQRLAFLVDGQQTRPLAGGERGLSVPHGESPALTVCATAMRGLPRALLVGDQYGSPNTDPERKLLLREPGQPAFVTRAGGNGGALPKALLVHPNDMRSMPTVVAESPSFTVTAGGALCGSRGSAGLEPRAWLEQGRVVSMTPRALARFQSLPDTYLLPDKNQLACKIVGNGVPSLFAQRIAEAWRNSQ
jgi:site-specific DNA-cytosine methylase